MRKNKSLPTISNRTKALIRLLVLVFSISLVILFFFKGLIDKRYQLNISAGSLQGKRSKVAEVLAKHAQKNNVTLKIMGTEGSQETIQKVSEGVLDLALIQGGLSPLPHVRQVAVLNLEALHLVVKKEIAKQGIQALKGKKINTSQLGSGTHELSLKVLEFVGITTKDFVEINESYSYIDLISQSKNTDTFPDAFFTVSLIPSLQTQELVKNLGFEVVELPFSKAFSLKNFSIEEVMIPKYTYSVFPPVPQKDIKTIGTQLILIANENVPQEAIKNILHTIFETSFVREVNFNRLNEDNFSGNIEFPLHEGALQFKNRNQPAITSEFLEGLENFRSFVFSFFLAIFLAWRWYVSKRSLSLDIYMKKVLRIEVKALELSANNANKEEFVGLLKQLNIVKHDGLKKVMNYNIKNENMLNAFISSVNDTRSNITQLMNLENKETEKSK